jgi:hypothetical protein
VAGLEDLDLEVCFVEDDIVGAHAIVGDVRWSSRRFREVQRSGSWWVLGSRWWSCLSEVEMMLTEDAGLCTFGCQGNKSN